jgi:hypothetical protein
MPKRPNHVGEEGVTRLALSLIDLRAHFEAQLRTVVRAEQYLRKCQSAKNAQTFAALVDALHRDVQILSDNNRNARIVLDQADVDVRVLKSRRRTWND